MSKELSEEEIEKAKRFADKELKTLENIFGSERHSNKRSAKKLRDLILPDMNSGAIKEITTRYDELIGYMDVFLHGLRLQMKKTRLNNITINKTALRRKRMLTPQGCSGSKIYMKKFRLLQLNSCCE